VWTDGLDEHQPIFGPGVAICPDCVDLCVEILAERRSGMATPSYGLYVLELDSTPSFEDEMIALLGQANDPNGLTVSAGRPLRTFFEEMRARWPTIGFLDGDVPWARDPELTTRGVPICCLFIVASRATELRAAIAEAAARHGLVFYDPQRHMVEGP
jgi:hypothetical protein